MPIPLNSIPEHIKNAIVQKLDFSDFVKFHQSSQHCFQLARKIKTRFSYSPKITTERQSSGLVKTTTCTLSLKYWNEEIGMKFDPTPSNRCNYYTANFCDFPIRFKDYNVDVYDEFTEEFCLSLIKIIEITNSSISKLTFDTISCSPNSFHQLIDAARVKAITFDELVSPSYLSVEAIRKISTFIITDFITEADVLLLNAPEIHVLSSNITSAGINLLLKQMLAAEQTVERRLNLNTDQPILTDVVLDGIPYSTLRKQKSGTLREQFIVGENENRYCLNFRGEKIDFYKYHYIPPAPIRPLPGFPFWAF